MFRSSLVVLGLLLLPGLFADAQSYRRILPQRQPVSRSRPAQAPYRLDTGDYLAVIVDGVLSSFKDAPVHMPGKGNGILPSMGHPVPVLGDGTVFLPLVRSVSVRGLTVSQANKKIAAAYLDGGFLKEERRIIVSLMRKRTVRVTVLHSRRDARGNAASTVDVQAQGATVLSALAAVGAYDRDATAELLRGRTSRTTGLMSPIRIGDTISMKSPPVGTYFTSGLLPGGEHVIPAGRRPTMLQAMAAAGGNIGGRFGPSRLMVVPRNGRPYYLDALRGGRA
ncbi:MAG: polysaccharide biosynthesis/export family protein, partial [Planctomycetaceae bacterium]